MSAKSTLITVPVLVLLLIFGIVGMASACSSYAIYGKETVYGMNFDFFSLKDLIFTLEKKGDGKKFAMVYFQLENDFKAPVVGMNEAGVFATLQNVEAVEYSGNDTRSTMTIAGAMEQAIYYGSDFTYPEAIFKGYRLINPPNFTLHSLMADKNGKAAVVEMGEKGNAITRINGKFIVMTNFPVVDFAGQSYKNVRGGGADRYKVLYEGIQKNFNSLTFDKYFTLLDSCSQFITKTSVVCFPQKQEVYFALNRDYTHIWKISIKDGTLETFRGFKTSKKIKLSDNGITASELSKWQ